MRNKIFDILRGFAILLMVFANAAPLFSNQFPFVMRILFSLPAPTFIATSGLMLALVHAKHNIKYFLEKAVFLLIVAMLVDILVDRIVPFQGLDVLYLIGFSMPLVVLLLRLPNICIYLLLLVIVLATGLLRSHYGYATLPVVEPITTSNFLLLLKNGPPLTNWFIEGWFPFFPWFAVILLGGIIGKWYIASNNPNFFTSKKFLSLLLFLLTVGVIAYLVEPASPHYGRYGYAEIFYPASLSNLCGLLSFTLVCLCFSEHIQKIAFFNQFFGVLGRSSLALYIIHLIIINLITGPLIGHITSLKVYVSIFLIHVVVIYGIAHVLLHLKARYQNMPAVLAWLLGK